MTSQRKVLCEDRPLAEGASCAGGNTAYTRPPEQRLQGRHFQLSTAWAMGMVLCNQVTCYSLELRPCRQWHSKQSHSIPLSSWSHSKVLFSKTMWALMRVSPNENYFLQVVLNLFCTFTVVSWPLLCIIAEKSFYPAADSLSAEHSSSGS